MTSNTNNDGINSDSKFTDRSKRERRSFSWQYEQRPRRSFSWQHEPMPQENFSWQHEPRSHRSFNWEDESERGLENWAPDADQTF